MTPSSQIPTLPTSHLGHTGDIEDTSLRLPLRVRVKICGITSPEDAEAAIAAGADALGFNTWQGSRRYLDLETATDWISTLPSFVTRVALCVNAPLEHAQRLAALPYLDALQFHGDESHEYCRLFAGLGRPFLRAVRLGASSELNDLTLWRTRQLLVDAAVPGAYGGTGCSADLALAAEAVARFPRLYVTLAGGLEPDNVAASGKRSRQKGYREDEGLRSGRAWGVSDSP
ncbi:MAG: phosphoribosylanthranilate isomerase [Proteobacteria bacterium]|nr:phosphoribosylanthranilate isomerase [Pseudomonadota bacterium]